MEKFDINQEPSNQEDPKNVDKKKTTWASRATAALAGTMALGGVLVTENVSGQAKEKPPLSNVKNISPKEQEKIINEYEKKETEEPRIEFKNKPLFIDREDSTRLGKVINTNGFSFNLRTIESGGNKTDALFFNEKIIPLTTMASFHGLVPVHFESLEIEQRGATDILIVESINKLTNKKETLQYSYVPGTNLENGNFIPIK